MRVEIPDFALVLMFGASGAGKSTFARRHFLPTEVLSSDGFRAMICDDENDQDVSADAFETLHLVLEKRLGLRRLTVVDATNLSQEGRAPLLVLAKQNHCPVVVFALTPPLRMLQARRRRRKDRTIPADSVREHHRLVHHQLGRLKHEGIRDIHEFKHPDQIQDLQLVRLDPWAHTRADRGPFDLIGDIHGCYDELLALLTALGYQIDHRGEVPAAHHPEGRKLVFLGDLVDRGPGVVEVIKLVLGTVEAGGYCVPGNHDMKLLRKLRGNKVSIRHGLETSLAQLEHESDEFKKRYDRFFEGMRSHLIFDEGRLVAVHAGLRASYIGRESKRIWAFALYGDVTGKTDEQGYPIRGNWAAEYDGAPCVVYGHTPVREPVWENNTLNVDTGCVFGHKLTALRYPERTLVSVPAARCYYPGKLNLGMDVDTPGHGCAHP